MTSNQIAYAQLLETKRANQAKERETERANRSKELEQRRSNVANEEISREGNAAKVGSPFGLISLFGERAVYGTDSKHTSPEYVQSGSESQTLYSNRDITAKKTVLRPGKVIRSIWDQAIHRSRGGGRGN